MIGAQRLKPVLVIDIAKGKKHGEKVKIMTQGKAP
jgi:hypothetical protein|tara:strand:+ start:504 stop:608 length:105 start_codon:yes stop_codon:yes gene_type:complete